MLITAKLLRRDAEDQASTARTEARRRSAISRAYYASYHRCMRWESLLPHKSDHRTRGGVHAQLIHRLQSPHPTCGKALMDRSEALGDLLKEQRDRRVEADYVLAANMDDAAMVRQFECVQEVFEKCADPDT